MLYPICSRSDESHIDTFYKLLLVKSSQLGMFTHLSDDKSIAELLGSIPKTSDILLVELLPEDIAVRCVSRSKPSGSYDDVRIRFTVTPQSKTYQEYLRGFHDTEVVAVLNKRGSTAVYGTTLTPLLFTFAERHGNQAQQIKGFSVALTGKVLGHTRMLDPLDLEVYNYGLAFTLTGKLS